MTLYKEDLAGLKYGRVASLSGLVNDSSGAPVPSAPVATRNIATNASLSSETDGSGLYRFASLPAGDHEVTSNTRVSGKTPGAVTSVQRPEAVWIFPWRFAGSPQSVGIVAAATDLSPDDASLGATIGNAEIALTLLCLRRWDDLIRLIPGMHYTDQSGAAGAGRTGGFDVHGAYSLRTLIALRRVRTIIRREDDRQSEVTRMNPFALRGNRLRPGRTRQRARDEDRRAVRALD